MLNTDLRSMIDSALSGDYEDQVITASPMSNPAEAHSHEIEKLAHVLNHVALNVHDIGTTEEKLAELDAFQSRLEKIARNLPGTENLTKAQRGVLSKLRRGVAEGRITFLQAQEQLVRARIPANNPMGGDILATARRLGKVSDAVTGPMPSSAMPTGPMPTSARPTRPAPSGNTTGRITLSGLGGNPSTSAPQTSVSRAVPKISGRGVGSLSDTAARITLSGLGGTPPPLPRSGKTPPPLPRGAGPVTLNPSQYTQVPHSGPATLHPSQYTQVPHTSAGSTTSTQAAKATAAKETGVLAHLSRHKGKYALGAAGLAGLGLLATSGGREKRGSFLGLGAAHTGGDTLQDARVRAMAKTAEAYGLSVSDFASAAGITKVAEDRINPAKITAGKADPFSGFPRRAMSPIMGTDADFIRMKAQQIRARVNSDMKSYVDETGSGYNLERYLNRFNK